MNLFKKAAVFTDLHVGAKGNSEIHNSDCIDFIDWFITIAHEHNCETCLFLGDYHNNRAAMNLRTMQVALDGLELLSDNFDQIYFLLGNHDIFFKDRRAVYSVPWAKHINNITVIDYPQIIGNVALMPWLIGDEWKTLSKFKAKYVFGHFEVPHFLMNPQVLMPDHGQLQLKHFKNFELAFSGHFHKRQQQNNLHYIGNAFGHNYADAGDFDRGMMILEWDQSPQYINWENQPSFNLLKLSELIDHADRILKPKQYLRVLLDIDVSFEEASFIKEEFVKNYNLREIVLIAERDNYEVSEVDDDQVFESVDQIVNKEILNIESTTYSTKRLLEIYNSL